MRGRGSARAAADETTRYSDGGHSSDRQSRYARGSRRSSPTRGEKVLQREARAAQGRAEKHKGGNDSPHRRSDVGQLSQHFGAVFTVAGMFVHLPPITGGACPQYRRRKVGKSRPAV